MTVGVINGVTPRAGVEGGEVVISCEGYDTSDYLSCRVFFDEHRGRLVSASPTRVIAAVPELEQGVGARELRLESAAGSSKASFTVGALLADNLHPLANPAIDHED